MDACVFSPWKKDEVHGVWSYKGLGLFVKVEIGFHFCTVKETLLFLIYLMTLFL